MRVAVPSRASPGAGVLGGVPTLAELPRLSPRADALAQAVTPAAIGWLNYWSSATAAFLGWNDSAPPAGASRTPAGAWLWRLTPDPLDLERPDHAAALVDAYRSFPHVGARLAPIQPS
jgi:hypothetical protein